MTVSLLEYSWMMADVYDAPPKKPKTPDKPVKLSEKEVGSMLNTCISSIEQGSMTRECGTVSQYVVQKKTAMTFSNAMMQYQKSVEQPLTHARQQLYAHGWVILFEHEIKEDDGFFARLYGNRYSGETVIAYRGTVLTETENLKADFALWRNKSSGMLKKAVDFYHEAIGFINKNNDTNINKNKTRNYSPKVSLTGHSLGGYLAQYVAQPPISAGDPTTIVFNAPNIGGFTDHLVGYIDPNKPHSNILRINVETDAIHKVGQPIGHQFLIRGNDACYPEALSRFNQDPNGGGGAIWMSVYCVYKDHITSTIMPRMEHLKEQAIDGIAVKPLAG